MNYTQLVASVCATVQNYETDFVANIPVFVQQAEQKIYNAVQFPSLRKNVTGTTTSGNKYLSAPLDYLASYSIAVIDGTGRYEYLINKDVNFIRAAYPNPASTGIPRYYATFGPRSDAETELSFILGPTPNAAYSVELHYFYYPQSIVTYYGVATSLQVGVNGNLTNGVYTNVPLTASTGQGSGCTADVTVTANQISSITVRSGGSEYAPGDTLLLAQSYLNKSGGNILVTVTGTTTVNPNGSSWLGDNFDSVLLYGTLVEAYIFLKGEADVLSMYDGKYKEALTLAKRLGDGMERSDAYRSGQPRVMV